MMKISEGKKNKFFLLMLALVLIFVIAKPREPSKLYDDAYMFIRYAHNLLENNVYGWNADEPSYGCTSILYVLSNAAVLKMGFSDAFLILLNQNFLYMILSVVMCYLLVMRIFESTKFKSEVAFVSCLFTAIALSKHISGMDTQLSVLLNFLLIYACYSKNRLNNLLSMFLISLVAYLNFLARPDTFIYAALFPFLFLILDYKNKKQIFYFCTFFASLILVHMVVLDSYFGSYLPIPYFVKNGGFYEAYTGIDLWNSMEYIVILLLLLFPFVVLLPFGFNRQKIRYIIPFIVPIVLTNLVLVNKVQIMGFRARLLMPTAPYIIAAALLIFREIVNHKEYLIFGFYKKLRNSSVLIALFIGLLFGVGELVYASKQKNAMHNAEKFKVLYLQNSYDDIKEIKGSYPQFAFMNSIIEVVNSNDFVIAASEHGYISAKNLDTNILCLAGLHNTEVLKEKKINDHAISNSLKKYNPDLIWMPHHHYAALNYHILSNQEFVNNYDFYAAILSHGIAIRKDSDFKNQISLMIKNQYHIEKLEPTEYQIR